MKNELINQFIAYLLEQKHVPSKVTIKNYRADVSKLIKWFDQTYQTAFDPASITPLVLNQYKAVKLEEGLSARSLERHFSSFRSFFSFLKLEGYISRSPFETLKSEARKDEPDPYRIKDFKNFLYVYNASHLTIKNYLIDVKQFLKWVEQVTGVDQAWDVKDKDIFSKINNSLIEEYKRRLLSQSADGITSFSASTVNRKLSSLRKYLAWAQTEGIIKSFEAVSNIEEPKEQAQVQFATISQAALRKEEKVGSYSPVPPIRLAQKTFKGINGLLETIFISPIVSLTKHGEYMVWKAKGKPVFQTLQSAKEKVKQVGMVNPNLITNIPKSFYAPVSVSTKYMPWHRKAYHHMRYTRPNWYVKYHSYTITHYFHFAVLIIVMSALGFGMYRAFFEAPQQQKTLAAVPTSPLRILSFQGRLTDDLDTPITADTNLRFIIYNDVSATAGARLWEELQTVEPDEDGIFSINLGSDGSGGNAALCNGGSPTASPATGACGIPTSLFAENAALWLGISVESTPELEPRQQLATVAYATNAETLQGLPPITAGSDTENVVLALDSSGNLTIGGSASPVFQATGGEFTLSGNIVTITTVAGTDSNIVLAPDNLGQVDIQRPIQNSSLNNNIESAAGAVEIDDLLAVLATSSGQSAFTLNQNGAGPLISASASGIARFTLGNDGSAYFAGSITGSTFAFGGVSAKNYNIISDSTLATYANSDDDLYIEDILEVGGTLYVGGVPVVPGSGSSYWNQDAGALFPNNSTVDLLVGGQSTSSAKFAVLNINNGTPTASISATSIGAGLSLGGDGAIQSLRNNTLTIGGDTTGSISLVPGNTTTMTLNSAGYVGIGTTNPTNVLQVGSSAYSGYDLYVNGTGRFDNTLTTKTILNDTDGSAASPSYSFNNDINTGLFLGGSDILGFSTGGAEAMRISSGKVGIGTTSPAHLLQVEGAPIGKALLGLNYTGTDQNILVASSSGTTQAYLTNTGVLSSRSFYDLDNTGYYLDPASTGTALQTYGGIAVGGSPIPGAAVYVNKNTGGAAAMVVNQLSSAGSADLFVASKSGVAQFIVESDGDILVGPGGSGKITAAVIDPYLISNDGSVQPYLEFNNAVTDGANDFIFKVGSGEKMRLSEPGNLTIGVDNPSGAFRLEVGGDIGPDQAGRNLGSALKPFETIFANNIVGTGTMGYWQRNNGALFPSNITNDLLLGSDATSSALFSVTGIASNQPIASLSGNMTLMPRNGWGGNLSLYDGRIIQFGTPGTGTAIYDSVGSVDRTAIKVRNNRLDVLSADGNQYSTITASALYGGNNASTDLTLDSSRNATKGDVLIQPLGGNVGIGTTGPDASLNIYGGTGLHVEGARSVFELNNNQIVQSYRPVSSLYAGADYSFAFNNTSGTKYEAAAITANLRGNTLGAENVAMLFNTRNAGTFQTSMWLSEDGKLSLLHDGTQDVDTYWSHPLENTMAWTTGGNEIMRMTSSNVGIGTTTPRAKLEVVGDASTSGSLVMRGTSPSTIDVLNGNTFQIQTSPGGDAGLTPRLTILKNGYVGIGTTNPQGLLDVGGQLAVLDNDPRISKEQLESLSATVSDRVVVGTGYQDKSNSDINSAAFVSRGTVVQVVKPMRKEQQYLWDTGREVTCAGTFNAHLSATGVVDFYFDDQGCAHTSINTQIPNYDPNHFYKLVFRWGFDATGVTGVNQDYTFTAHGNTANRAIDVYDLGTTYSETAQGTLVAYTDGTLSLVGSTYNPGTGITVGQEYNARYLSSSIYYDNMIYNKVLTDTESNARYANMIRDYSLTDTLWYAPMLSKYGKKVSNPVLVNSNDGFTDWSSGLPVNWNTEGSAANLSQEDLGGGNYGLGMVVLSSYNRVYYNNQNIIKDKFYMISSSIKYTSGTNSYLSYGVINYAQDEHSYNITTSMLPQDTFTPFQAGGYNEKSTTYPRVFREYNTAGKWIADYTKIYTFTETDITRKGSVLVINGGINIADKQIVDSSRNLSNIGTASLSGQLTLAGTPTIQSTAFQSLVLGGNTTGNIVVSPLNGAAGGAILPVANGLTDIGSSSLHFRNIYADNFIGGSSGTQGYWQRNNGAISPSNITDDFLLGATSTSSALFSVSGIASNQPIASVSGNMAIMAKNGWGGNLGIGYTSTTIPLYVYREEATGTNRVMAQFQASPANNGGSTILRVGNGSLSSDIEHNASGNAPFRYGAYADTNIVNNYTSAAGPYGNIHFVTNDAIKMTITGGNASGNVGIGTTTPKAKLDVIGDASTSGSLVMRGTSPSTINVLNGNRLDIQTSPGGDVGLTPKLTILGNGNVGIGTINPNYSLDVEGRIRASSTSNSIFGNGTTGGIELGDGAITKTSGSGFKFTSGLVPDSDNARYLGISGSSWGGITIGNLYSSTINSLKILSNGNVGVGTTSPAGKLHTDGTSVYDNALAIFNETGGNDIFTASASGNTRFVIDNSGYVGIGTTNPLAALHVNGSAVIQGAIQSTSFNAYGQNTNSIYLDGDYWTMRADTDNGIQFKTNLTTDAMTILSNANVGIGTTNPSSFKLEVGGNLGPDANGTRDLGSSDRYWNNLYVNNIYGSGTVSGFWQRNNGALSPYNITDDLLIGATSTSSALFSVSGTTGNASTSGTLISSTIKSGTGPLNLQYKSGLNTWGNALTVRDNTGYVGVGTTEPEYQLDVINNSGMRVRGTGAAATELRMYPNTGNQFYMTAYSLFITPTNLTLEPSSSLVISAGPTIGHATLALKTSNAPALYITGSNDNRTIQIASNATSQTNAQLEVIAATTSLKGVNVLSRGGGTQLRLSSTNGSVYTDIKTDQMGYLSFSPTGEIATFSATLNPSADSTYDLGSPTAYWSNLYVNNIYGSGTVNGFWQRNNGALSPVNISDDFLLGGVSTSSAKFAVLNMSTGTPVASVSATSTGKGVSISGDGFIQSLANNSLTIGGGTTGHVLIMPHNGASTGRVGIGTSAPSSVLEVDGDIELTNLLDNDATNFFDGTIAASQTLTGITSTGALSYTNIAIAASQVTSGEFDEARVRKLESKDTRNDNYDPQDYTSAFQADFKTNGTDGLADGGSYHGVLSYRPYGNTTDWTGGPMHQLGFTSNANLWLRTSTGDTSWGDWRQIASDQMTNDFAFMGNVGIGIDPTGRLQVAGDEVRIGDAGTPSYAAGDGDLYVEDVLEVGGALYVGGVPVVPGSGSSYWNQDAGALFPNNSTVDLLVGAQSSSSAKFAVLNINNGTPTASVSATSTGKGLSLGGDGIIQSLRNNTLTIGGNTTGNIALMPLNGSGNVGIGTTAPSSKLHISSGAIRITSDALTGGTFIAESADGSDWFTIGESAGLVRFNAQGGRTEVAGSGDLGARMNIGALSTTGVPLAISGISGQSGDLLRVDTNGTGGNQFIIKSTGNVGIGTAAPSTALHIASRSASTNLTDGQIFTNQLIVNNSQNTSGNYASIGFNTAANLAGTQSIARIAAQVTGTGSRLHFATSNNYGLGPNTLAMTINENGNVGIGTTNPSSFKLEVGGNLGPDANGTRDLGSSDKYWNNLYVNNIYGSGSVSGFWQRTLGSLAPTNITDAFNVGSVSSSSATFHAPGTEDQDAWFNLGTGNLGVGTTTPDSTLEVSGGTGLWITGSSGPLPSSAGQGLRLGSAGSYSFLFGYDYATGTAKDLAVSYGNFGIGTNTPTAKLDISGSASLSGNLAFNLGSTQNLNILNGGNLAVRTSAGGDAGLSTKITILNNGNVGIGASPSYKLHVSGTGYVSDTLTLPKTSGALVFTGTGQQIQGPNSSGIYLGWSGGGNGNYFDSAADTSNYFRVDGSTVFKAGTSNSYFSGNLSVGTTNSGAPLVTNSSAYGFPVTSGTSQTNAVSRLQSDGGNVVLDSGINGASGAWLQVTLKTDLSYEYPLLLNPNGGSVGIGTTSVSDPLTVNGRIVSLNASDDTESIKIEYHDGYDMGRVHAYDSGVGYKSILIDGDGNGNQLVVNNNGNVGIKVTDPDAALEVNGQVKITGGSPGANKVLTSDGDGLASWQTIGEASITDDSLDFVKFEDTLDLDANLTLNQSTYTWTQNYTGTTTDGFTYNANSLTSGTAFKLSSTSTGLTTGGLFSLDWSPASDVFATGDLFSLNIGQYGNIGNIFNVKDNNSSLFSISETGVTSNLPTSFTSAGDVSMAYDLVFTNPSASYIKSAAPLYIQAGEMFNSSDLTLTTYNKGNVIVDSEAFVANQAATVSGRLVVGTSTPDSTEIGGLYLTNSSTFGKALAILNQTESQDIFTASASGTPKFAIKSNGNTEIYGQVKITGGGPGAGYVLTSDADGLATWSDIGSSGGPWTLSGNNLYPDSTAYNVAVGAIDAGTAKLYVNGNVGIGTTTPATKLETYRNTGGAPETSGTTRAQAVFRARGGNEVADIGALGTGAIWLQVSDATNLAVNYPLLINPNGGNVGIGTSAPLAKLDVNGVASISGNLILASSDSTGRSIQATRNNTLTIGGDTTGNIHLMPRNGSGYVGIGTTNPGATLDVIGSGRFGTSSNFTIGSDGIITSTGTAAVHTFSSNMSISKDSSGTILSLTQGGTGNLLDLIDGSTTVFTVLDGGNVGIGTTSPDYKLQIESAPTSTTSIIDMSMAAGLTTNPGTNNQFGLTWSNNAGTVHSGHITVGYDGTYGNMYFGGLYNGGYKTISDQLMVLKGDGKLGIGTPTPDYTLDVAGNVGMDEYLYHNGDADTFHRFLDDRIQLTAGNINFIDIEETTQDEIAFNENGGDIDFRIESNGGSDAFFVEGSSGKIGVGTVSPGANLDVEGRTTQFSNLYPVYRWRWGGAQDLNWKKIADVSISTASTYAACSFKVDINNANTNFGHDEEAIDLKYFVSTRRSCGSLDSCDDALLSGSNADYVRVVKTATGVFELQVRQPVNWKHLSVQVQQLSVGGGVTVTYADSPADGSTVGTIYTPAVSHTDYLANANVAGTLAVTSTITAAVNETINGIDINNGAVSDIDSILGNATSRFTFGGIALQNYNAISDSTTATYANSDDDLYVEDILEVGGALYVNGVPITGSGSGGSSYWNQNLGSLFPNNSTVDLLVGGQSTSSAKFAVLNVNSGQVTASVSGNLTVMPDNGWGGNITIENNHNLYAKDNTGAQRSVAYIDPYNSMYLGAGALANLRVGENATGVAIGGIPGNPGSKLSVYGNGSFGTSYATTAAPANGLIIEGNVGIGTTGPLTNFDVRGNIGQYSADGSSLYLGDLNFASANYYNSAPGLSAVYSPTTNVSGDLAFYTYNNGVNSRREIMRMLNNGNVGIGVTDPIAPLDFGAATGNKIFLYPGDTTNSYGFGIGASLLQVFSAQGASIAFGEGSSTSFTENVRIDADGDLGIGTTNPLSKLHVKGELRVGNTSGEGGDFDIYTVKIQSFYSDDSMKILGNLDYEFFGVYDYNKTVIGLNGNVGIGTVDPQAKLEVFSGTNSHVRLGAQSSDTAGYNYFDIRYDEAGNYALLQSYTSNVDYRDLALNPVGGNVGIGIAYPKKSSETQGTSLTINSDGLNNPSALELVGEANNAGQVISKIGFINNDYGTSNYYEVAKISLLSGDLGPNYGKLGFFTADNGTLTERIRLDEYGKVGIGTTSPAHKLHVSGETVGKALVSFNATGTGQNILTASSSGTTQFYLSSTGSVTARSFYDLDDTNYFFDPAATGTSLKTLGSIGIGGDPPTGTALYINKNTIGKAAIMINQLSDADNADLITASVSGQTQFLVRNNGDVVVGPGGTGKLTAVTLDPLYTIDGAKYSTYGTSMIGVKEEIAGKANLTYNPEHQAYTYSINLNNQEVASDLWLFSRVIDQDLTLTSVLLTPDSNARVWYQKDVSTRTITFLSDSPTSLSYRLTAPRFDHDKWANISDETDPNITGLIVPDAEDMINEKIQEATAAGSNQFEIAQTTDDQGNIIFVLIDSLGNQIKKTGDFSNLLAANIKAGFIDVQSLAVENMTINGQAVADYIASIVVNTINNSDQLIATGEIVSPSGTFDQVRTDVISPLASDSTVEIALGHDKVEIKNKETKEVVTSIDDQGNASFAGTLTADNAELNDASIAGTLRVGKLIADNIEGLATESAQYITNNYYVSTPSAEQESSSSAEFIAVSDDGFVNISSFSGQLAYVENLSANFATFNQGLMSFGPASFADVSVAGQFAVGGNLIIADSSINVLGTDLHIQPLKQGGVNFMAGAFTIDENGNLVGAGNATFKGTLFANVISPIQDNDLVIKLDKSELKVKDASGSAVFAVNSKGDVTASGSGTFKKLNLSLTEEAYALSGNEIIATGSAGVATISARQNEITIYNDQVTEDSLIYITPKTNTANQVLFLMRQVPEDMDKKGIDGSFTVGIDSFSGTDIPFNWMIVN